jgi:hypothetical protein
VIRRLRQRREVVVAIETLVTADRVVKQGQLLRRSDRVVREHPDIVASPTKESA